LDRRVKEESEKRKRIANILNKRREEFLDLVKSFMGSYGNKDGQLIDAKDFKQILEAFGIKLNPYVSGSFNFIATLFKFHRNSKSLLSKIPKQLLYLKRKEKPSSKAAHPSANLQPGPPLTTALLALTK